MNPCYLGNHSIKQLIPINIEIDTNSDDYIDLSNFYNFSPDNHDQDKLEEALIECINGRSDLGGSFISTVHILNPSEINEQTIGVKSNRYF